MPVKSPVNQSNTIPNFFRTASAPQDMSNESPKRKQRTQGTDTQSPSQQSPEKKKISTRDEDTEMAESQPPGAEVLEMEIDPGPEDQGIPAVSATNENIPEDAEPPDKNPHDNDQNNPENNNDERASDKQDNKEDSQGSMEQEDTYDPGVDREKTTTAPALVSPNRSTLRSAVRNPNSYANRSKAAKNLPNPTLPRWQTRRFAVSFDIKKPKDMSKRTEYLAAELNKLLTTIGQFNRVYVRKFEKHCQVHDAEKQEWKKEFNKDQVSDIQSYTHGFYFYGKLREGNFRLLIQLVLPLNCVIKDLLMNVNGNKWACKNNRAFRDIQDQNLYDPKFCGWLFRSNYSMVASSELQKILEARAAQVGVQVSFGLSYKMIPGSMAPGAVYDRDRAVKAVCIMTNAEDQHRGWEFLHQWYNKSNAKYPMSIPMKFIPSKDHPDIKNNSVAIQNLSHLIERQRVFTRDTTTMDCPSLADPTAITSEGKTLRYVLKNVIAKVSGPDLNKGKLFHAITSKTTQAGEVNYQITYHRCVEREARNIIGGLAQFIEEELKLDPEDFCHAHMVDNTHSWDPVKRCIRNSTTDYLAELVGEVSTDDEDGSDKEEEEYSMDSKAYRESRRILGLEDTETVTDLKTKKKKKTKKKDVPAQINESQSVVSEMTGLTPYSSASKASQQRKELRNQVKDKDRELEKYKEMVAQLLAQSNNDSGKQDPKKKDNNLEEESQEQEQVANPTRSDRKDIIDLSQQEEDTVEDQSPQNQEGEDEEPSEEQPPQNPDGSDSDQEDQNKELAEVLQKDLNISVEARKTSIEGWDFEDVYTDLEKDVKMSQLPLIQHDDFSRIWNTANKMKEQGYKTTISQPDAEGKYRLYLENQEEVEQDLNQVRFRGYKSVQKYDPKSGEVGNADEVSLEGDRSQSGDEESKQKAPAKSKDEESSSSSSISSSSSRKSNSSSSSTSKPSSSGQASDSSTDKSNDSSKDSSLEDIRPGDPPTKKQVTKKSDRVSTISRKNLDAAEKARTFILDSDDDDDPFNV